MSIPLIIANYLIRYLMPHWGLVKLGIYSHFILAAAIIIFILPKSANALWFTILPIGFMITVSEISSAVLVSNAAGEHEQGTIMGVYRSLQVLTELLAALFGGLLASINIHAPFIVSCGFAILAALLLIFFKSALTKKDVLKNHREI
jgi:MFS family permease